MIRIDDKHNTCKAINELTQMQIDRARKRLESRTYNVFDINDRSAIEDRCNIIKIVSPALSWCGLDVENDAVLLAEKLQEVFNRVL